MMQDDIFHGIGVEITLPTDQNFLKVRETLTRIGRRDGDKTLYQTCYILHKRGRYVIAHINELSWLDGDNVEPSNEDIAIRNRVALLLHNWGLVHVIDQPDEISANAAPVSAMKILAHREKGDWQLVSEYDIGGSARR